MRTRSALVVKEQYNRSLTQANNALKQRTAKMVTLEELDRDPWQTYPVNKDELRELISYRDIYHRYDDIDPLHMQVHYVRENSDGSADVEFTVGREVAREFIRKGFLAAMTEMVEKYKDEP
jgi:hypothetical protein